jgi:signal transduction histidine kinase
MLRQFVAAQREEILARARLRVAKRNIPAATDDELTQGLPVFLDQLDEALIRATSQKPVDHADIQKSASQHGHTLFLRGLTVAQVVHDYGDLCQVITELAVEQKISIAAADFSALNLCLDDAIAGAVTEYAHQRDSAITETVNDEGAERLGVLCHEMRNHLGSAMLALAFIKKGTVGVRGRTGEVLDRGLLGLQNLLDRSLADVRLDAGIQNIASIAVWELIEEVEVGASMLAQKRNVRFSVESVDHMLVVRGDRQILAAAVFNLLQNAFKFTLPDTTVTLRSTATATRVLLEVEDGCGGLPPGKTESLLAPFEQRGSDRTGLGLGLSICSKAVKAMDGELRIRDLPGKGCIFTIDLPKRPSPPTPIRVHSQELGREPDEGGRSSRGT